MITCTQVFNFHLYLLGSISVMLLSLSIYSIISRSPLNIISWEIKSSIKTSSSSETVVPSMFLKSFNLGALVMLFLFSKQTKVATVSTTFPKKRKQNYIFGIPKYLGY